MMTRLWMRMSPAACLLCVLPFGCAPATPPGPATPAVPSPAAPIADSPAAAVNAALASVQQGRFDQAYDFLPVSYHQDIDGVIQTFAAKMDPEIWDSLFRVAKKAVQVLKEKDEFVLASLPVSPGGPETDPVRKNWTGLVDSLEMVVTSDISQLDKLKSLKARQFLERTGNPFFAKLQALTEGQPTNPLAKLSQIKVEVVSQETDKAVLKITAPDQPTPEETPFVRVEDRWIPQSLADSWQESLKSAKDQLEAIKPEQIAAQKQQLLKTLGSLEGSIDKLLAAQSADEFQAGVFPLMIQAMQIQSSLTPSTPSLSTSPSEGGTVMITIPAELTEAQQDKLIEQLEPLTDNPQDSNYTISATGGTTRVSIGPVQDPVAFTEKLTFAAKSEVDEATRTITLELKPE